jgi:hypothetical protein
VWRDRGCRSTTGSLASRTGFGRGAAAVLVLLLVACRSSGEAIIVMVVTISGSPSTVSALEVTLSGPAGASSQSYAAPDGRAISFPTTLSAELPVRATGEVSISVSALAASGLQLAAGELDSVLVEPNGHITVYVGLSCGGAPCTPVVQSGSAGDAGTSAPASDSLCGNGRIDPGETCDIAIAPGDPGACPPSNCDDGVSCTQDIVQGSACTLSCFHELITTNDPNDGCCPSGATAATDSNCSASCGNGVVDPGETCDTGIAPGLPGACPIPGDCTSPDPCALTLLASAGTCEAICLHYQVAVQRDGDGCCPPGATNADDSDCPASCGDGVKQTSEICDVGITPPGAGSCPTSCEDGFPCTTDFQSGTGCDATCVHLTVTAPISGDGCCPAGANRGIDTDCAASCGDGIVEPGESCDKAATGAAACPSSCPPAPSACLTTALTGSASDCSAACVVKPITACSSQSDGCCPAGCTVSSDPDCSATCGDGVVQSNETCDIAITAGMLGSCPVSCDDGDPCTTDLMVSAGTCEATCVHLPVTAFVSGDGCCPPGGEFLVDADCPAVCGNGIVEPPVETCDKAVPGSCPTSCSELDACTVVTLRGSVATCSAACIHSPVSTCIDGDGCCPPDCTAATDSDCPAICGDGLVEAGEQCDRAITDGIAGNCGRTCNDYDACTVDIASGVPAACTRRCTHIPIVACLGGDGCCPDGCTAATDSDCAAVCGDGRVEAGETCDPPSSCPTACPDSGDPCARPELQGDPSECNLVCRYVPITTCSGAISDGCCPTGCTADSDSDC